jgi:hypothetical protein
MTWTIWLRLISPPASAVVPFFVMAFAVPPLMASVEVAGEDLNSPRGPTTDAIRKRLLELGGLAIKRVLQNGEALVTVQSLWKSNQEWEQDADE